MNASNRLLSVFNERLDNIAVITNEYKYTYQELLNYINSAITYFNLKNISVKDRVAVELQNSIEFLIIYLAAFWKGYTIVPINPLLPEEDKQYIKDIIQPKEYIKNKFNLNDIKNEYKKNDIESLVEVDVEFGIFFTSGTTSKPKGVCHTANALIKNAEAFNEQVGLKENVNMLHVMPMGYMAGFLNTVLCPLLAGGTVILAPQFNVKQAMSFWDMPIKFSANTVWLSPTMAAVLARLNRSQKISDWTKKNLKSVFVGTAPFSKSVREKFESTFSVKCLESYGMTETLFLTSQTPNAKENQNTVGSALKKIEVQIRNEDGERLNTGEEGRIWVKTDYLYTRYFNSNETDVIKGNSKWFFTGDQGSINNDREITITGRIKDIIIHGGTNISPRSVEDKLREFDEVQDVVVYGVPHPFWGEEVVASIIPKNKIDLKRLKLYCEQCLSPDAVPAIIKIVEEFPRTSTGKIQVQKLRDMI